MKFDFSQSYVLENERVILRRMTENDFQYLKPFSIHEPNLWEYSLTPAGGVENMKKYIAKAVSTWQEGFAYPFIVFDKKFNEFAGSSRYYAIEFDHDVLTIGFTWYGSKYQGTGLNKNCKYLMLDFAFNQVGVERVEFRADLQNKRSIAAMKSIGCTQEGVLRSNCRGHYGRRDSIVLSILKDEWNNGISQSLYAKLH